MSYARPEALVEPAWLSKNLNDPNIVVIDDISTYKDFVHAKEESHNSFIAPDKEPIQQPEKTIALSVEKKEYPKENNLFFLTPQPESTNLEIQVQSHSITPLLNGYASNDFVSSIHPRDWADPTWAGENESPQIITDKRSSERVANLTVVDLMQLPLTMQIPAIGVDSSIENFLIIQKELL